MHGTTMKIYVTYLELLR